MNDDFFENERAFNERKNNQKKINENVAKGKLKQIVNTSIQTTMIGALVDFEEFLGFVWGHGKDYNDLTEDEKEMRELWLDARDSILSRGNNSKKLALAAVNRSKVIDYPEKRYNITFKDREERNGRY